MLGKILQNRYEIIAKIGEGGMALVYKAKDTKLGRWVALKILKDEYARDKNFIARFKNEARAYAALNHPNIISVYDIAEDQGYIFLALEYIEAESLKEYMESKKTPEFNEVLKIFKELCGAISYAHEKGIIHRDIKPSNVLIDKNGKIKVTDFGIARITQTETVTQGTMLGSVYYFSPEQAQGREITPASDIYSLGILAYQMLTGKLPFEGENAVAVALKHVKDPPPKPSADNNKLSPEADNCLLKALDKNPQARQQSVSEFYRDFSGALSKLSQIKLEDTILRPAIKVDSPANARNVPRRSQSYKSKNYTPAIIFILILICAGAYFLINSLVEKTYVPDLVNMTLEDAEKAANQAGFVIKVRGEEPSVSVEPGKIIRQEPAFGGKLRLKSVIWVTLSKKGAEITVPNIIGQKTEDAQKLLESLNLKLSVEKEVINKTVPAGVIIGQKPAPGANIAAGSTVYCEVSQGPTAKSVPNLIDLTQSEAEALLKDLGLTLEVAGEKPSAKIPKGNIIDQDPKSRMALPENKTIQIYISSGFDNLIAPNLIGLGINEAKQETNELGLDLIIIGEANVNESSQVVSQVPDVGAPMKNNIIKVKLAGTIVVPDLIGKTKEEAEKMILDAGFVIGKVEYLKSSMAKSGTVIEQDPKSGLEVPSGQKMDLVIVK